MLVRLLYASRLATCWPSSSTPPTQCEVLDAIVNVARVTNAESGITGVLCYGDNVFLQLLEGGRAAVNALYARILADPRHQDVTLLHYEEITERKFGSWTMGQVDVTRLNASTLLKYSDTPKLDPFSLSGAASVALLNDLMATASIMGRA